MHSDLLHLQRYHDSGDASAFKSLVQNHASMVFATARRVTRDSLLAEDVAQETFLELARKGRTITDSVGAWLHRVAWRRACDVVRAETTRRRYETAALALDEGRECTWEELEPVFDEALAELAAEERLVIVEHYLEVRTQTEIAGRMGVSQASVSRLLDQSIVHLRAKLKTKGLLCGAALGAMMSASSSQAAPATLVASLHKIALSSIGSGAAVATGGSLLSTFLGFKIIVGCALVLAACLAGYDLASKDSRIARWFALDHQATVTADSKPLQPSLASSASDAAATKERLLAEARTIWDNAPRYSKEELIRLSNLLFQRDPNKRFTAMHDFGMRLSRAEYDRVLARHPDVMLFDERKGGEAARLLMIDLRATWTAEAPREAVAWETMKMKTSGIPARFPSGVAPWVRTHPDAWAAFVEAGPDPQLADYARVWVEELDDPGSIWAKARDVGMSVDVIGQHIFIAIETGAPADPVFHQVMRCPDSKVRDKNIVGIMPRLTSDQLSQAADSGLFTDANLVNLLRGMAGESSADFGAASGWLLKAANGGGEEAQLARWSEACIGRFYEQWAKVDTRAALQHSVRTGRQDFLDDFMRAGSSSAAMNEEMIVAAFSSQKNRDHALAAFYQAKAGGDPVAALQNIIGSSFVEDQIEAAKLILQQWTIHSPQKATAWLESLPASEDHVELVAVVASQWADIDPEAAFEFTQRQGQGLSHGWAEGLAWGARGLPETSLAAIFAKLRNDPDYNHMLTRLVGWRCPSSPKEAFALLTKYAAPGWQTPIVNDTIRWLQNDDARAEDYALQMPMIDLSQVDPQRVITAAQLLVQRLDSQDKLQTALDWTLKLPSEMAPQARAEAVPKLDLSDNKRRSAAEQWIRSAAISEGERASLLQQVSQQAQRPAVSK